MARKRWTPKTEVTQNLVKAREKRKWQIALRRYIIEKLPSTYYAPFFGLDIHSLRNWMEIQFEEDQSWENFGKAWQIEHQVPLTCFDLSNPDELKLCWNFINLKVENLQKKPGSPAPVLKMARAYFKEIYEQTGNPIAAKMLNKIKEIETLPEQSHSRVINFLKQQEGHLQQLESFGEYEFELINKGIAIEEINNHLTEMKKINL